MYSGHHWSTLIISGAIMDLHILHWIFLAITLGCALVVCVQSNRVSKDRIICDPAFRRQTRVARNG
jgi:hypothetical protein